MLLDEDRVQRGVEVRPIPDARRLDRGKRIEPRARPERNPGVAQGAREVGDVLRQGAAACRFGFPYGAHFAWLDLTPIRSPAGEARRASRRSASAPFLPRSWRCRPDIS